MYFQEQPKKRIRSKDTCIIYPPVTILSCLNLRVINTMKTSLTKWLAAPSQPVIRNAILLVIMFVVLYVIGKFMPEGFDWGLASWTPLLSNRLGAWAWHFGNLMSVCLWAGIFFNRQDPVRLKREAARRAETENPA